MNRALWTCRHTAALLAGLLVALATGTPGRAYEPVLAPDLAYVPSDAAAFLTVRTSDLADKLGLKDAAGKHPWAVAWQKSVGIPLTHIERCTLVSPNSDTNGATCLIIITNKPCKRAEVLKACVPDAKEETHSRKSCQVSPSKNTAVHFVSDRLLLVGDTEAVLRCLAQATKSRAGEPSLTEALVLAASHDVVLWSHTAPRETDALFPSRRSFPVASLYKRPVSPPPSLARTVTVSRKPNLSTAFEGGSKSKAADQTVELGFLPIPLPAGVQAGTLTIDVGDQLTVALRLQCVDEASATKSAKMMRAFVGMARAELLALVSELDMLEAVPSYTTGLDNSTLPMKLIRQAEKGLQTVRVQADGKTVPVSITIPMDAKALRTEMGSMVKLSESCGNGQMSSPLTWFKSLVLVGDPQGGRFLEPTPSTVDPLISPVNPLVYLPPAQSVPPTPATWSPQPTAKRHGPQPLSTPPLITPLPTDAVKLTVANVSKEPALLFTIGEGGKLTFAQKIPPGEAVDLQTTNGQRWIAVFTGKPGGDTFTPSKATETWLLRPEPTNATPDGPTKRRGTAEPSGK